MSLATGVEAVCQSCHIGLFQPPRPLVRPDRGHLPDGGRRLACRAGNASPIHGPDFGAPTPAELFNGTVIVEFMQEYFGTERDTNYRWNVGILLREGIARVGFSLHHERVDKNDQLEMTYWPESEILWQ